MCIAVLGVLKSGAAYVPLDPADPPERLKMTLTEAAPGIVITQAGIRDRLSGDSRLFLNIDDLTAAGQSETVPACPVGVHNLAYIIYTSGSTGKPKGIGLSHGALRNLLYWYRGRLRPNARVLQFASLTFDVSFLEMLSTWITGGTLYICPQVARRDALVLMRMLCDNAIERAILPVVVLQQVADAYRPDAYNLRSLREVITTGDQLRITSAVAQLFRSLGECTLENHYGPSEAHVVSAYHLPEDPATWPTHPPIGRPISNLDMYLLDEAMLPVPVGSPGHLYLGGAGLARGYVEQPDLTAERFVPDPYTGLSGGRLYKTGDLARFRDDGNIEFLGRLDHQVKVRGYRVELGEIEAALSRHAGIRKAVVAAPANNGAQRQLIAWLIPESRRLPVPELRAFLAGMLPDYMIPSEWVWLETLPLTSNGKLDYARLPAPEKSHVAPGSEFMAPANEVEELVASICREVLNVDRLGTADNFLDLGGNSLLAMQVMVRVRDALHVEVPLSSFFEAPTVSGIVESASQIAGGITVLEEIASATMEVGRLSAEELTEMLLRERAAQEDFQFQPAAMSISA
jgi:amino acid adenylation domain-containing protein